MTELKLICLKILNKFDASNVVLVRRWGGGGSGSSSRDLFHFWRSGAIKVSGLCDDSGYQTALASILFDTLSSNVVTFFQGPPLRPAKFLAFMKNRKNEESDKKIIVKRLPFFSGCVCGGGGGVEILGRMK